MPKPSQSKKKSAAKADKIPAPSAAGKPHIPDGHHILLGDCLDAMTELRDEHGFREQVDLVYLDPPFNSKSEYSFIFGEENAAKSSVVAFTDSWQWESAEAAYDEYIRSGNNGAEFLKGMRHMLGTSPRGRAMLSYLTMMVPRLALMRELLKPTGNIILHCDQTASHYLKTAMDSVFGAENFRNEIIWCYRKWTNTANHLQRNHDTLLFYAGGADAVFNKPYGEMTSRMKEIRGQGYNDGSAHGKKILRVYDRNNPKARKKIEQGNYDEIYYIDAPAGGSPLPDYWDISILNPRSKERMGYPTQKPLKLLRRIVEMASNPGGVVLDPFCGCGTTLAACIETKRECVGIDLEPFAVHAIETRMAKDYEMNVRVGPVQPKTEADFANLAAIGKYGDFQYQAIKLIDGAFPNPKVSGDEGVDGWVFVRRQGEKRSERIVISVKAGANLSPAMVRELRGVVEGHGSKSLAGILMTMGEPTPGMISEAEKAGMFSDGDLQFPRIQILPIRRLLEGRFRLPRVVRMRGLAGEYRGLYSGV